MEIVRVCMLVCLAHMYVCACLRVRACVCLNSLVYNDTQCKDIVKI